MWFCSECGKKNNGKFCTYCGTKYVEVDENFVPKSPLGMSLASEESDDIFVPKEKAEEPAASAASLFRRHCGEEPAPKAIAEEEILEEEPSSLWAPMLEEDEEETPVFPDAEVKESSLAWAPTLEDGIESDPFSEDPTTEEDLTDEVFADFSEEESIPEETELPEEDLLDEDPVILPTEAEDFGVEGLSFFTIPDVPAVRAEVPLEDVAEEPPAEDVAEENSAEETLAGDTPEKDITAEEENAADEAEPYVRRPADSPYPQEAEIRYPQGWKAPFLREKDPTEENGSVRFLRKEKNDQGAEDLLTPEEAAAENSGIGSIFTHRHAPETGEEKVWRYGQKAIIAVGAVVGVVFLAVMVMVGSLLVDFSRDEEVLPASTGIDYYVSGVKDTTPLYEDKSINSNVLADLKNGDAVEFLDEVNSKFIFVYHAETEQYGYVRADYLVADLASVDYGDSHNKYADEKSLGYWYVTKTENGLNLWENPDGGGVVKAKLKNGFKVSVLEKTNDSYWYVFDYNSAERGYVRTAYLTDDKSKVVGIYKEPKDKTVIGDYWVTGVKNYLPIYAEPSTDAKVRGKLNNGDKVGLIQKTNGKFWYISANGVYGWVSAAYLTATNPAPAPEPTPAPDTSNDYKVYNTQEYLPVLKDPQVGGEELAQIHNGDTVTFIKEYDDKFWYVKIPSLGIEGYVAKDYLTK